MSCPTNESLLAPAPGNGSGLYKYTLYDHLSLCSYNDLSPDTKWLDFCMGKYKLTKDFSARKHNSTWLHCMERGSSPKGGFRMKHGGTENEI